MADSNSDLTLEQQVSLLQQRINILEASARVNPGNPNLPIKGKYNTYIGARYVPKFATPIQWSATHQYEPLTIVTYQGNSYTSKTFPPVGALPTNETYWAPTGNYNAQVELYRQDVMSLKNKLNGLIYSDTFVNSSEIGEYLLTGGFYTPGDGGGGLYVISNTPTGNLNLNYNNLYAHPVDKEINLLQLGLKPGTNITTTLQNAIDDGYNIIINKGYWLINSLTIPSNTVITTPNFNYCIANNGTEIFECGILVPQNDVDTLINMSNSEQCNLSLVISTTFNNTIFKNVNNMIKMDNSHYNNLDLIIYGFNNIGLEMSNCWENIFNNLMFRKNSAPESVCIHAANSTENCSQNYFNNIQSEGSGFTIIKTEPKSGFTHNFINSILHEGTATSPYTLSTSEIFVDVPLLNLASFTNSIIESLIINNLNNKKGAINGITYGTQTLIGLLGESSNEVVANIRNIMLDNGISNSPILIRTNSNLLSAQSKIVIGTIINGSTLDITFSTTMNMEIGKVINKYTTQNIQIGCSITVTNTSTFTFKIIPDRSFSYLITGGQSDAGNILNPFVYLITTGSTGNAVIIPINPKEGAVSVDGVSVTINQSTQYNITKIIKL